LLLAWLGLGCQSSGVGDPCTPEDEYQTRFSGYSVKEANVESRSFQCETRVCLVNHFQGRVSCPYGESDEQIALRPGAGQPLTEGCSVPGTSGARAEDRIEVQVEPQLVERRAERAVYCSCRCDGPDSNAKYCECPSGYACVELVKDLGLGSGQLAGSYCVKDGTEYNSTQATGVQCSRASANCE
jgi:hypothetical protein